jgi:hypothetical protein
MILFYFIKSTKMIGYPINVKIRHETKNHEFQINSITKSVAAKQVFVRIIINFFDCSPK